MKYVVTDEWQTDGIDIFVQILVKDITFDLSLEGDFKREDPTIVVEAMPPTVTNEWKQITSLATNYRYQNVKGNHPA